MQDSWVFSKEKPGEPGSCPVDHDTMPVYGGLMAAQRQELTGALTAQHCRAQKLAGREEKVWA
jgi:hypothetical protein